MSTTHQGAVPQLPGDPLRCWYCGRIVAVRHAAGFYSYREGKHWRFASDFLGAVCGGCGQGCVPDPQRPGATTYSTLVGLLGQPLRRP